MSQQHKPVPANLCLECNGRGQTKETATETKRVGRGAEAKTVTTALGSGCPKCKGRGIL